MRHDVTTVPARVDDLEIRFFLQQLVGQFPSGHAPRHNQIRKQQVHRPLLLFPEGKRRRDEQPVFPVQRGGANGVLHQILVDLDASIVRGGISARRHPPLIPYGQRFEKGGNPHESQKGRGLPSCGVLGARAFSVFGAPHLRRCSSNGDSEVNQPIHSTPIEYVPVFAAGQDVF